MLQNPQHLDTTVSHVLMIGSGLFWTLTYLLILRRGFLDKTYGMPMAAICANISWEFIFSVVFPHPQPQLFIDYLWLLFDVGIVWQYLKYGKEEFAAALPRSLFYVTFLLTLVFSSLLIAQISIEFKEYIGIYAAFAQNFMMSVLFVHLFLKRNSLKGQSIYIALCKLVGTVFPSMLFYLYFPHNRLLLLLYIGIFLFDLTYFFLLYFKAGQEGKNPWARV